MIGVRPHHPAVELRHAHLRDVEWRSTTGGTAKTTVELITQTWASGKPLCCQDVHSNYKEYDDEQKAPNLQQHGVTRGESDLDSGRKE